MAIVYLGIGSNLGNRHGNLDFAWQAVMKLPVSRYRQGSRVYQSQPVGPVDQNDYLNQVLEIETELDPRVLLSYLQQIEQEAGREPLQQRIRWGPRKLDIDILLYDERVIDEPDLSIPHQGMHNRWWVLKPLCDLNPSLVHPLIGKTVRQLLDLLEFQQQVEEACTTLTKH